MNHDDFHQRDLDPFTLFVLIADGTLDNRIHV